MSSLLEQAIVDAKALKEVAIKNAETAILERYSDEVRAAVTSLLEAPEDEEMSLGAPMLGDETPGLEIEVPDAHADGEELCSCPDEDEEITIDFRKVSFFYFFGDEIFSVTAGFTEAWLYTDSEWTNLPDVAIDFQI